MSLDFRIQTKCDHVINWEKATLQSDRRSIYVTYTIASVSSLRLRINNVEVPRTEYTVATKRQKLTVESYFYILMKSKIKDFEPLIEVKYVTELTRCPKCRGVRILDDIKYTSQGDIQTIDKEFLLVQQVEKFIVTALGSNIFHNWMGTGIQNLVSSGIKDFEVIRQRVVEQVNSGIEKLKNVQRQLQSSNRKLDPGELFGQVVSIDVERSDDPTIVLVTVAFTAQSGRTVEFSQYLEFTSLRERRAS